jgi:hypothetical protein
MLGMVEKPSIHYASKLFFCGFISFIVEIPPKLPLSPKKIEQSIEDG